MGVASDAMSNDDPADTLPAELARVRARMAAVLEEVDRLGLPGDIGAHMDLAIRRLDEIARRTQG
jgi:hypothetical protein